MHDGGGGSGAIGGGDGSVMVVVRWVVREGWWLGAVADGVLDGVSDGEEVRMNEGW